MKATKTGKIRYRTQSRWFGKELVVLQMEWEITDREHWSNCGGMIECESLPDHKEWRDATVEDLTEEILVCILINGYSKMIHSEMNSLN